LSNYIKYNVNKDESDIRIDRWLRRKFINLPQSFFEKKLRKGIILLNKKKVKSNKKVFFNDLIEILDFSEKIYEYKIKKIEKINKVSIEYQKKFRSSVIYENNDYIVINKWRGMPTQGGTKIKVSIDHIIKTLDLNMSLVHRIDKDTTGALIISKNYKTTRFFNKLFKEKKIGKIYFTICQGKPKKDSGIVKLKINKNDKIISKSEISETIYELYESNNDISTVIYIPITGKTHQIRKVAKHLGCPILGDNKYGKVILNRKNNKQINLMLHSLRIFFNYNKSNRNYFAEPDKEMTKILNDKRFKLPNYNVYSNYKKKLIK